MRKIKYILWLILVMSFLPGCSGNKAKTVDKPLLDMESILLYEHLVVLPSDIAGAGSSSEEESLSEMLPEDMPDMPDMSAWNNVSEEMRAYLNTLDSPQEGRLIEGDGGIPVCFYTQIDARWADLYYGGTDTIEKYACGPTSMSIVVSSLTGIIVDPVQMSAWANENGYWYPQSGSLHAIIPDIASHFGLIAEGVENTPAAADRVVEALKEGSLVVVLMGKGHFTKGGHFIVLRGRDKEGKILVADAASEERTQQHWDLSIITKEAKTWAAAGGPYWIISKDQYN